MKFCESCQEDRPNAKGKFCSKCGSTLVERGETETVETVETQAVEPEEHVQVVANQGAQASAVVVEEKGSSNVQEKLKSYWQYSLALLKNPTKAINHQEKLFNYGLVNIALYGATLSLIIALYMRSLFSSGTASLISEFMEVNASGLVLKMFFYSLLVFVAAVFISTLGILIVEKITVKRLTYKSILTQYSGLLMPFIYLNVAALLFSLIGSAFFTFILIGLSLFYSLIFLPAIYLYEKARAYQTTSQVVYVAIGTSFLITAIFAFLMLIFGMSVMETIFELIDDLTYFGF